MNINVKTQVCGIIGHPLTHSMSPAIHNAAARHHKLNVVFVAFSSLDPKGAVAAMRALNLRELTVTMPYKETVVKCVDRIEKEARELGNINTIINNKGVLTGHNTDIDGIKLALKGIRIKNKIVLLLGAGGAAKTIAYVIHKKGGKLHILNRDISQARVLARKYKAQASDLKNVKTCIAKYKPVLIINATPVGMEKLKGKSLVPKSALKKEMAIFDLIYNPEKTKLILDAQQVGCKTINGRTMFIGQGARQFELWSGKRAPWKVIEKAFIQNLKK